MSLFQNNQAKYGRTTPPVGYCKGAVMSAIFEHTFTEDFTAADDILEIGVIPATAKIISAVLVTGALGASATADLSLMTGVYADRDDTRDADGSAIQSGIAAHSAEVALDVATLIAIAVNNDKHRGLGLEFNQDITAGATKTIQLVVQYHF